MKRVVIVFLIVFSYSWRLLADEGMWLVSMLSGYPIEEMQKKGFMLSASDIYNINQSSMKDGIVIFGWGCTGEIISSRGLVLTNHHCGYGAIQSVSTVDKDYLTQGFWAMNDKEEIPIKGLTVTFLDMITEVTEDVLRGVTLNMEEKRRKEKIEENIQTLLKTYKKDFKDKKLEIKSFFNGNQYMLLIYTVYKDVRLVGAPPSSIGKFGGDTDNWMWPRHTGDFSLFRIYANKNNEPAEYSPDNVPLKPKKFFEISLKGYEEGDFTMVMGYPGRTSEYLPSVALEKKVERNNVGIRLREKVLDIYSKYMKNSHKVKLQYSVKYARIANYWKKWIGENKGLRVTKAIDKKKEYEKRFLEWAKKNHRAKLLSIFESFEKYYNIQQPYLMTISYFYEGILRAELVDICKVFDRKDKELWIKKIRKLYKDFYLPIDKEILSNMLYEADMNIPDTLSFKTLKDIKKKYKGDFNKYVEYIYSKSLLTDTTKLFAAIKKGKFNKKKDPIYQFYSDLSHYLDNIFFAYYNNKLKLDSLNRVYMRAQMDFEKDKHFYPDANFTMRVSFGQIKGFGPADAVEYRYFTTLKGIIEKEDTSIYDYKVPQKLKEIYYNKDYGRYVDKDGSMHVCFIATNHTSGGNSGSPVFDKEGRLIGINFDRAWEGTMSDLNYDISLCRNIAVDIRYFLLIVDKYAGAKRLIDEMVLVE